MRIRLIKTISLIVILFIASSLANGINYTIASVDGFHPLYERVNIISPLQETHPSFITVKSNLFKDTTMVDFEKRQVTFVQFDKVTGIPIWQFHYSEINEYLKGMMRFSMASSWKNIKKKKKKKNSKKDEQLKLEFALPINYPAWARRILGKEAPKLSIKGFQSISLIYNGKNRKTLASESTDNNLIWNDVDGAKTGGMDFDYNNEFTIKGSIGRLITVEIKTGKNTDANMSLKDQMKTLKIEYKADPDSAGQLEDEIIQEVTAGFTNFSMPGQGLAGFSGSHEGLFGVKVKTQWGPLELTTIVSNEKAETKKKMINPSKDGNSFYTFSEAQYLRNKRFFLDTVFINKYLNVYDSSFVTPQVSSLLLYKRIPDRSIIDNTREYIQAKYDSGPNDYSLFIKLEEGVGKDYELDIINGYITFTGEYISDEDILAINLVLSNGVVKGVAPAGAFKFIGTEKFFKRSDNLWLLKDRRSDASDPSASTYKYMWRNIYGISSGAKENNFRIDSLSRKVNGVREDKYAGKLFSDILGLTKNGIIITTNKDIVDFDKNILIIPPYKINPADINSAYSNRPFENPALGDFKGVSNTNPEIYLDSVNRVNSMYEIVTTGTSKQTSFSLGFGIVEGTETLKMDGGDGRKLEKGVDYSIDYDFATVTLLSDDAKNTTNDIQIEFQQESMFSFESKQFLGAYGKLDLPNIGLNSFLATTVMGQFTTAKDNIPKAGYESYNRFLFDANIHLNFEPEWMTNLVNYIPLVNSTTTSSATLDFEVAYSNLTPDKDNNNQGYMDDFKSVESETSLMSGWNKASPDESWLTDYWNHPEAWFSYWYSPVNDADRTDKTEILNLSDSEKYQNKPFYLSTIRLVSQGLPIDDTLVTGITDKTKEAGKQVIVNPWAGMMSVISRPNRTQTKYLEFWVKNVGSIGTMYLDMGEISEDLAINGYLPNGKENTERRTVKEKDPIFDLGLDETPNDSETYIYPKFINSTFIKYDTLTGKYDSLGRIPNDPDFIADPARDNYALYDGDHLENKAKSKNKEGDTYLSSEDLDYNGFSTANNYYRVTIDFSQIQLYNFYDNEESKTSNDSGKTWSHIKIPINTVNDDLYMTKIGNPSWQNIDKIRVLWTDFDNDKEKKESNTLEFYDMKFTENQWRELTDEFKVENSSIDASTINTTDDNLYKEETPPEKHKYLKNKNDKNNPYTDYALQVKYEGLKSGEELNIEKKLSEYQTIDISNYKEVRFWAKERSAKILVNGNENMLELESTGDQPLKHPALISNADLIDFVFRFGSSDSCYYEYSRPFADISSGGQIYYSGKTQNKYWKSEEGMNFKIQDFMQLKQNYLLKYGEDIDSINALDTLSDGSQISVFSKTGILPSMANITWMSFGVRRDENAEGIAYGEIWLNGLRIWGIRDIKGWAFRAGIDTRFADLMDLSADLGYDESDFRKMAEKAFENKDSRVSATTSGLLHINKFMPNRWGVNIPIGANLGASINRPRQRPGTDIFLTDENGEADHLGDMAGDFVDLLFNTNASKNITDAEHFEKNKSTKSWRTSFSKTSESKTSAGRLTLDRLSINYSFSDDSTTKKEGEIAETDWPNISREKIGPDHIDVLSAKNHSASLKYDFSPGKKIPKWTSWAPFRKKRKLPQHLRKIKFNLLPKTLKFDILNADFRRQYSYRSIIDKDTTASLENYSEGLTMKHGLSAFYAPIDPLFKVTYNLNIDRNFDQSLDAWKSIGGTGEFISSKIFQFNDAWKNYYILQDENYRSQNISLDMSPQFFDWLTHTVRYSSNYTHAFSQFTGDETEYIKTNVNSKFSFNSTFRFINLVSNLTDRSKKLKRLNKVVGKFEDMLNNINLSSMNFSYNGSLNMNNNYLGVDYLSQKNIHNLEFFEYQFGLKGRSFKDIVTGDINDYTAFGAPRSRLDNPNGNFYQSDRRTTSQDYSISTRFKLPKPLYIQFTNISLGWGKSYTVTYDSLTLDSSFTFPNFRFGVSSEVLEEIPLIKRTMKNLGLRSSYSFSIDRKMSYNSRNNPLEIKNSITKQNSWQPLIRLEGVFLKKPVNVNYQFGYTKDSTLSRITGPTVDSASAEAVSEGKKEFSHEWNIKYTVPSKKERSFKIFKKWKVNIKGELKMEMRVAFNKTKLFKELIDSTSFLKDDYKFEINPKLNYDFTDNIVGRMEYRYIQEYLDNIREKKKDNMFDLTITIYFK